MASSEKGKMIFKASVQKFEDKNCYGETYSEYDRDENKENKTKLEVKEDGK